jgi:hypothetical protein
LIRLFGFDLNPQIFFAGGMIDFLDIQDHADEMVFQVKDLVIDLKLKRIHGASSKLMILILQREGAHFSRREK